MSVRVYTAINLSPQMIPRFLCDNRRLIHELPTVEGFEGAMQVLLPSSRGIAAVTSFLFSSQEAARNYAFNPLGLHVFFMQKYKKQTALHAYVPNPNRLEPPSIANPD